MLRNKAIIIISIILLLPHFATADDMKKLMMSGTIATGTNTWNADNFAGFYYDIDDNIKTEQLTATITEGNKLSGDPVDGVRGVIYTTTAQRDDFDFDDWGSYNVIGFLGEKYFAGYVQNDNVPVENQIPLQESEDENVLSDEQLLKILVDDDTEWTITSGTPLVLKGGYELAIRSIDIDGNKVYLELTKDVYLELTKDVYLELTKDGEIVDSKAISPSIYYADMADKTYFYRADVGDSRGVVLIAVHFKNAFRGADTDLATVDGVWQLSDTPEAVSENTEYDEMIVERVTADTIVMENEDNDITLSKNRDIRLMPGISIKTADADDLRYYIYKEETEPGAYEIRGSVSTGTFTWNADNFAGFYYDIDDDIKTEQLTATVTDGNKLRGDEIDGVRGVVYTTTAQKKGFAFDGWGNYNTIGFLGQRYFAGYIDDGPEGTATEILVEANSTNLLLFGELAGILVDEGDEKVLDLSKTIDLMDGYALKPTVGTDNKGLLVELLRNGTVIDRKAILLPGTYVYAAQVGDAEGVPVIAAHFQSPIFLSSKSYCKVDGLWQLSENATDVEVETVYDKMRIASVDSSSGIITMDNMNNDITLSKNKAISLMPGISIETADADELRYYVYKEIDIASGEVSQ